MALYGLTRTMKALPIGSVQPWTGPLTQIPRGWLLCNGAEIQADQYPLLARILKNTYGGVGFEGNFPNYSGTVRLPPINQKGLADIGEDDYFGDDPLLRPNEMDTVEAYGVVQDYIGDIGDFGTPSTVFAVTDLLFNYEPDADGFINSFSFIGTAAAIDQVQIYRNIETTTNGSGTGATFNVVQNTNGTYSIVAVNKGEDYDVGDTLTISYTEVGGTDSNNDIVITVESVGDGFFSGRIEGQSLISGFGIKPVYVVARKLSREHFPQHFHPGSYRTINKNDAFANPGKGAGVYDNPSINLSTYYITRDPCPSQQPALLCPINGGAAPYDGSNIEIKSNGNVWGNQTGPGRGRTVNDITQPFEVGPGRYALGVISGSRPARTHSPLFTAVSSHGIGKDWFNGALNLRDALNASSADGSAYLTNLKTDGKIRIPNYRIPFSDDSGLIKTPNYDDASGGSGASDNAIAPLQTLFNVAGRDYNKTSNGDPTINEIIFSHDHGGEFNIQYNGEALTINPYISAQAQPDVTPDNIENAFQITFSIPSPSLAIVHLVRAY